MKRTTAGLFCSGTTLKLPMTNFTKPALDLTEQIASFKKKGLQIDDEEHFLYFLKTVGYYRLSGYMKSASGNNQIVTSDDLLSLYNFDRQLRLVFLNALERIEIASKSLVSNHMALTYGPFWYNDPYAVPQEIIDLIKTHKGPQDQNHKFIVHYRKKYTEPKYPPSWMVMEVIGMSDISKIISKLTNKDLKPIAEFFNHSSRVIKSWLRSLTITRNICAHHGRLWDRFYTISPERTDEIHKNILHRSLAEQIVITNYLMGKIDPRILFDKEIFDVIETNAKIVNKRKMGFLS